MKNLLVIITFLTVTSINAQKLEDVTKQVLEAKYHHIDSSAAASYLYQKVDMRYDFTSRSGAKLFLDYTYRIKVYNKEGESYGRFEIPMYSNNGNRERVSGIKGKTYNLVNGKVVTTKLDKKDIYEEETSENWDKKIFALPEVKSGSVIEVNYTVTTPFIYSIPKWFFQHEIPTDKSIFELDVPGYFVLTPIPSGSHLISNEREELSSQLGEVKYTLTAVDVPVIREDIYVLNENDYRSGIKYELESIKYPSGEVTNFSKSWNEIAINLNEANYFGREINRKLKDLNAIVEQTTAMEPLEKIEFLYNYVRDNYVWNEKYSIGSYDGLSKFVKEKNGSVGDFNILLQNLLKKAGVESYHLVMKSRYSGILNTNFPTLTDLNYVIVYVPQEEGYLLLDASSDITPLGELPLRAINFYGVIVKDNDAEVITLDNPNLYKVQTVSKYTYDLEQDRLLGNSKRKRTGYASTKYRYDMVNKNSESQESEDEDPADQDDDIESYDLENLYEVKELKNLDDTYKPISLTYEEQLNTCSQKIGDKVFIDATLDFGLKKNPFDEETRDYPVFYNYAIYSQSVVTIALPEGYVIESLPEPLNLVLQGQAARFTYSAKQMGDDIVINYLFKVDEQFFSAQDYEALKRLYDMMSDLSQEKLVLTKA